MAEYDQYVAAVDIYYPSFSPVGTLAYALGDRVPASNVTLYGYLPLGWVFPVGNPSAFDTSAFDASFR